MVFEAISPELEYGKNPDVKKEDIVELSKWIKTQPHLPELSELQLIAFHHSRYGCMELTKKTIDYNFTVRTEWSAVFEDLDPTSPQNFSSLDSFLITFLPGVTKDGYKVIFARLMKFKPAEFFFETTLKIAAMSVDLNQMQEGTHSGTVLVIDMDRVLLGHLPRLGLMAIKKILFYVQEAMPIRLVGVHFINAPTFMDKFLAIIKPFLRKSYKKILFVHSSSIVSLYKYVPKEMFPKEVGGGGATLEEMRLDMKKWLVENRDFFLNHEKLKADETKRPSKSKRNGKINEVVDSFDKLDID